MKLFKKILQTLNLITIIILFIIAYSHIFTLLGNICLCCAIGLIILDGIILILYVIWAD